MMETTLDDLHFALHYLTTESTEFVEFFKYQFEYFTDLLLTILNSIDLSNAIIKTLSLKHDTENKEKDNINTSSIQYNQKDSTEIEIYKQQRLKNQKTTLSKLINLLTQNLSLIEIAKSFNPKEIASIDQVIRENFNADHNLIKVVKNNWEFLKKADHVTLNRIQQQITTLILTMHEHCIKILSLTNQTLNDLIEKYIHSYKKKAVIEKNILNGLPSPNLDYLNNLDIQL